MAVQFEWDLKKAESNLAKHGVSFEIARGVFADPFAIDRTDDRNRQEEERWVTIGLVAGYLLYVVYTERNDRIRLISARQATRNEQDDYFRQNT